MPKFSRDKGNRFERRISKLLGEVYNMRIGRVPLSGALHLKCDVYDIDAVGFPLYIECKFHESFKFSHITGENWELYGYWLKCYNDLQSNADYFRNQGFIDLPVPMVVFKGGIFKQEYALIPNEMLEIPLYHVNSVVKFDSIKKAIDFCIVELDNVDWLDAIPVLKKKRPVYIRHQEDDGYAD